MTRALIALLAALAAGAAAAEDAYPSKPITMIVPFPPGGVADIVGRPLATVMQKSLKHPVVVVNRTGAGGAVGMAAVAKSAPDGYTILMGLSSISIFPVSDRINGKEPLYEMSDFSPIALVTADPTVLVVRSESPYKTLQEFVAGAKARPGKINYSSSGVYGTLHVAMEIFANAAGIQLFHVPYQGGGPAVTALLAGQVEASAQGPAAVIGQVKAGIWSGVFAPAATPAPIVNRLREAVKEAVNSEEFRGAMEKVQTPLAYLDAPEFKNYWERDAARLKTALEKIGKVEEKQPGK
ncbi:MAG: tripartite tricarboxylate transporter substrate binding protein [Betaproteobacteria bacterium]|nr:tripartite tricarboxylate transporter substrate binding protein [Betaproteobacteria bacterium]